MIQIGLVAEVKNAKLLTHDGRRTIRNEDRKH